MRRATRLSIETLESRVAPAALTSGLIFTDAGTDLVSESDPCTYNQVDSDDGMGNARPNQDPAGRTPVVNPPPPSIQPPESGAMWPPHATHDGACDEPFGQDPIINPPPPEPPGPPSLQGPMWPPHPSHDGDPIVNPPPPGPLMDGLPPIWL